MIDPGFEPSRGTVKLDFDLAATPVYQPTMHFRYKEVYMPPHLIPHVPEPGWKPDMVLQQLWMDANLRIYQWRIIPMVPANTPDNCL